MTKSCPLTIEVLNQRDGKPVWVEKYNPDQQGWAILRVIFRESQFYQLIGYSGYEYVHKEDYGVAWNAYDHEPEGE